MFFGCALALVLTTALAEHSTTTITQKDAAELVADAETKKRPQPAFLHERDDLDKYQGMQESASRLRDADDRYLELVSNELEKRASMRGFQGMRGKKADYEPAASYYYGGGPSAALLDYYNYKRAPMGFQGMRGKKSGGGGDLLADDELEKRAPMGFQGMRGKKSLEEVLEELEKRSMMGFQGMRGKKAEEFEEAVQQQPAEWQKRAPMGFQGMRGRKSSFIDELDELEKRAILGFHGMRGKKDVAYERDELPMDMENYVEKRPMMMGFHGMRGKRSADYYGETSMRYEKRSPYRFFGTRGKKNPRWELRGKFVGVRGKKWTMPPDSQQLLLRSLYDDLRLATESERH